MNESTKCPVMHGSLTSAGQSNMDWWPKSLNLDIGLKTYGFSFGREDIWHQERDTYWGSE